MEEKAIKWLADTQVIRRADTHTPEMPSNWVWIHSNEPLTKAQIEVMAMFLSLQP